MKNVLASLVAVGLMATAANAATIGLRWAGNPNQNNDGPGTVEVYLQLIAGDVVSGANGDLVCVSGDCSNLSIGGFATDVPNWSAANTGGAHIGTPEFAGLSAFAGAPQADALTGPGSFVLATFNVGVEGPLDGSVKGIGIDFPGNPGGGVIDATAGELVWDARYNTNFAGYVAFGDWGNPGWAATKTNPGQPTPNPLLITKTPEPTSLALVALGGFALLRRRR